MEYINLNTLIENIKTFEPLVRGLIAILTIIFGWIIGIVLGKIVRVFLNKIKFNKVIKRLGWKEILEKAELGSDGSKFFGKIVELIIIVIFIMVAFDIAGINYISNLIEKIVAYFPNIVVASLIFIAAVYASDFSYRIVVASSKGKFSYSKIIGSASRAIIWIFAILAILLQLKIAPDIVRAIAYGIIAMVAIAGGLAFGLGGKDIASEILKEIKNKFS